MHRWIEEHGDYLFRYCLRHFRDESLAEDLVQETFLGALRSRDCFEGRAKVRTWLTSILRNKIIDRIRELQRRRQVSLEEIGGADVAKFFDDADHWVADSGPRDWSLNPEAALQNREFLQKIEQCLSKLPEKLRLTFVLREMDDLDRDEIAEQLQVTGNNVGVMLHRARLLLRDCLQLNWFQSRGPA